MNNKILLVAPKCKAMMGKGWDVPAHPHLGLSYLASFLRKNEYEVVGFDIGIANDYRNLRKLITDINPFLIGITSYSYSYSYLLEAIEAIKRYSDIPVVIGGPHVTLTKEDVLLNSKANYAIKGEGEFTLLELANKISKGEKVLSNIDGLIWQDEDENIIENIDREYIKDLDPLPYPDFMIFDIAKYPCYKEKSLPLMTERGCPYSCTFCAVRKTGFRARSPENVITEIKYWFNMGFFQFDINDDCFNLDVRRATKICDLIMESGLKIKYSLYNGIRANRVTFELLKKIKESGCIFLSYGLETGNPDTLKRIEKKLTLEQVKKASVWTREVAIRHAVNFIIGHPGENYNTAMDSVRFAKELLISADYVNFYNLVPYPGTSLFKWVEKHGKFLVDKNSYLLEISYRDNKPIFETEEFTAEERMKVVEAGFDMFNRTILEFRFGKVLGKLGSFLMKSEVLISLFRGFFFRTIIGRQFYTILTKSSRK